MKKGNWEKSFPVISVLMGDIMQSVENALLIGEDFICYDVVTRTSLSLGDRVTYEGEGTACFSEKNRTGGREVIFTYRLAGNSYGFAPVTGCIRTNGSTCEGLP